MKEPWHKRHQALMRHAKLVVLRQIRPLSCVEKQLLRQIFMKMAIGPSYPMGLLHLIVWVLVGTSYRGDPLNVGGSGIVNISGARRRASSCLWMNVLSTPLINHLVKAVTYTPYHPRTSLKLVTPHLPDVNTKFHISTSALSVLSPINFPKKSDWSQEYKIFCMHQRG